jgi:uncharacterized membrane protein HdeD (DUF308 family)
MIRLALLLLGPEFIRTHWKTLAAIGVLWALIGGVLLYDAFDGAVWFPYHLFGYLLILEALVTLVATTSNLGTQTVLRKTRGVVFFVIGLLIIDPHPITDVIVAVIFGVVFLVDGSLRISAAWVVRFPHWPASLLIGVFELVSAALMFLPHPVVYIGTVPYCIGAGMLMSGIGAVLMARRLRRLPPGTILSVLFSRGDVKGTDILMPTADATHAHEGPVTGGPPLTIHVWTPVGSAKEVLPQPLVDRYLAAVDGSGVISTGHAALEVAPDLYISHYPANEIDHSPDDFRHLLRATQDNNVAGRFQPNYAYESAAWCPSTAQVKFERYDRARLRAFWKVYSQDATYNLTNRNCSSTVAAALEASLEGTLGRHGPSVAAFLSSLCNPELWVAAQLRKHARSMAWTPGLVLDYARSLRVAINPPPLGIVTLTALLLNAVRGLKERRAFIARVRARAAAARDASADAAGVAAAKVSAKGGKDAGAEKL